MQARAKSPSTRPLAVKDWSSDDTEPGDDEAFSPVLHGVLDPASGQVDSVSGQEDELVY